MLRPDSFEMEMRREFRGRLDKLREFYRFYYQRAWREQPGQMLQKIGRQMLVFYALPCPAYRLSRTWQIAQDYDLSADALTKARVGRTWASYPPLVAFLGDTQRWAQTGLVLPIPGAIRKWESLLAFSYLPCLGAAMTMGAWLLVRPTSRRRLGLLVALVVFFYWYNFGNCLEIAVVHSLDNHRYDRAQLIFTIMAQAATFLLALEFACEAVVARRELSTRTAIGERSD